MSKRKKSGWGWIVVVGFLVYFAWSMVDQQGMLYRKDQEMKKIEDKINEEKRINEQLKKQKDTMNSDEYVEKVAREKLGMVKKGERVFVDIGK